MVVKSNKFLTLLWFLSLAMCYILVVQEGTYSPVMIVTNTNIQKCPPVSYYSQGPIKSLQSYRPASYYSPVTIGSLQTYLPASHYSPGTIGSRIDPGYRISEDNICPDYGQHIMIICLVMSAPQNSALRRAIRQTWGSYGHRKDVGIGFFLASTNNSKEMSQIAAESESWGDIIQAEFLDSYRNLTLKSLSMLDWVHRFCFKAKYFLKVDDDSFINFPLLLDFAKKKINDTNTIWGNIVHNPIPVLNKSSKLYLPNMIPHYEVFPDYTSGAAYLISGDSVTPLGKAGFNFITNIHIEDVVIGGILADFINMTKVGPPEFNHEKMTLDYCQQLKDRIILRSGHNIHLIWKILSYHTHICTKV